MRNSIKHHVLYKLHNITEIDFLNTKKCMMDDHISDRDNILACDLKWRHAEIWGIIIFPMMHSFHLSKSLFSLNKWVHSPCQSRIHHVHGSYNMVPNDTKHNRQNKQLRNETNKTNKKATDRLL